MPTINLRIESEICCTDHSLKTKPANLIFKSLHLLNMKKKRKKKKDKN